MLSKCFLRLPSGTFDNVLGVTPIDFAFYDAADLVDGYNIFEY